MRSDGGARVGCHVPVPAARAEPPAPRMEPAAAAPLPEAPHAAERERMSTRLPCRWCAKTFACSMHARTGSVSRSNLLVHERNCPRRPVEAAEEAAAAAAAAAWVAAVLIALPPGCRLPPAQTPAYSLPGPLRPADFSCLVPNS